MELFFQHFEFNLLSYLYYLCYLWYCLLYLSEARIYRFDYDIQLDIKIHIILHWNLYKDLYNRRHIHLFISKMVRNKKCILLNLSILCIQLDTTCNLDFICEFLQGNCFYMYPNTYNRSFGILNTLLVESYHILNKTDQCIFSMLLY